MGVFTDDRPLSAAQCGAIPLLGGPIWQLTADSAGLRASRRSSASTARQCWARLSSRRSRAGSRLASRRSWASSLTTARQLTCRPPRHSQARSESGPLRAQHRPATRPPMDVVRGIAGRTHPAPPEAGCLLTWLTAGMTLRRPAQHCQASLHPMRCDCLRGDDNMARRNLTTQLSRRTA